MKKVFLSLIFCMILCTACGSNKAVLEVPDQVETPIEDIKKANLEGAKMSFINIAKTAKLYYLELQLDAEYTPSQVIIDFSDSFTIPENFVFSGSIPTKGILIIDIDGNITLNNIVINDLTCNYDENNEVICK